MVKAMFLTIRDLTNKNARFSKIHRELHTKLARDVQREHPCIPLGGLRVLVAHQGLDHLLRHLMLNQMHRKRISKSPGRHRADGKRHTVTCCGRHGLAYPAARRVLAFNVPQAGAGCRLRGRKPLPKPLHKRRIGEGHRARRVIPDFRFGFALRLLLLPGRPPAPAPAASGRRFQLPLFERAQHHERRGEGRTGERIVQHKIPPCQRQNFIEPAAGVPERIDEQAFAEIGHPGQQHGHLGRQQVAGHVGAVRGGQVAQRHRAFIVKVARGAGSGQIMTTDVAA